MSVASPIAISTILATLCYSGLLWTAASGNAFGSDTPTAMLVEPAGTEGPGLYIVQLADPPIATYTGDKFGLAATAPRSVGTRKLDVRSTAALAYEAYLADRQSQLLNAVSLQLGRSPEARFYYRHAYNGVAIELTPSEAREVAKVSGVTLVFRDIEEQLLTDTGPAFMGAPAVWTGTALGSAGTQGEGVIVGVLDTGINHDHPSFAATDALGYTHTNPFGAGNYLGHCVANPSFCNSKLIGAWVFHPTPATPEDSNGHGSHTASTAAGNSLLSPQFIAPTASFQFASLSGVAPRANVIAYLVCAPSCPTSATTAAVNQAVIDGVDVINYSISGGLNPWVETTAVAFRNAVAAGVVVANSAGNAGPGPSTVGHQAPWNMTVAASTHDRAILSIAFGLSSSSGGHPHVIGEGAATGVGPAPIIYAGDPPYNNPLCNLFPEGTFNGEIVFCDRGAIGRVLKGSHVLAAGGAGMILANDAPSAASLNADGHVLPAIHISHADGVSMKAWLAEGSNHGGSISGGAIEYGDYGNVMASFSARGPAGNSVPALADTIKPDLTAPGLNILAAYHTTGNPPAPEYSIISGTSMSSPHAAGAAALLRAARPNWTAVEIKSALMMASVPTLVKEDASTPATAFDQGAGGINLDAAVRSGIVLDISDASFVAANPSTGGVPRELNLPSMANASCAGSCSWTRTVRSTLATSQQWQVSVVTPLGGFGGTATPASFTLEAGATQEITIEAQLGGMPVLTWLFGHVELQPVGATGPTAPGVARMPIAVRLIDGIFANGFQ